jgi:hypothetical protein
MALKCPEMHGNIEPTGCRRTGIRFDLVATRQPPKPHTHRLALPTANWTTSRLGRRLQPPTRTLFRPLAPGASGA